MKRFVFVALAGLALTWDSSTANAQGFGTYSRPQTGGPNYQPPVSPYLNILRGGNPATGYFTGTLPQQDAFRSIGVLQYGLLQQQGLVNQLALTQQGITPGLDVTGHPVRFFYNSHYYTSPSPRFGPGSSSASPTGTPNSSTGSAFGAGPVPPGGGIGIVFSTGGTR